MDSFPGRAFDFFTGFLNILAYALDGVACAQEQGGGYGEQGHEVFHGLAFFKRWGFN
jgi:hypothetical protein